MTRLGAVWLCALLLAACGQDDPAPPLPEPAPSPPAPVTQPAKAPSLEQAPSVAAEPEPEPVAKREPDPVPVPSKQPTKPALPKGSVEAIEVEAPELDLSLPEDWAAEIVPERVEDEPLLPPLFGDKEPGGVGLSGRLLSGQERDDDSLVDGAELQFEFRR